MARGVGGCARCTTSGGFAEIAASGCRDLYGPTRRTWRRSAVSMAARSRSGREGSARATTASGGKARA